MNMIGFSWRSWSTCLPERSPQSVLSLGLKSFRESMKDNVVTPDPTEQQPRTVRFGGLRMHAYNNRLEAADHARAAGQPVVGVVGATNVPRATAMPCRWHVSP